MHNFRLLLAVLFASALTSPAANADGYSPLQDRVAFERLVKDKKLSALGVGVFVTEEGRIYGRAFGREITGQWDWVQGYFCRDLNYGAQPLPFNCQLVETKGDRIRFTSDRGTGQSASLRMR